MKPSKKYITIGNNVNQIKKLINELILTPRLKVLEWSKLTRQTPNIKIGYLGQHIASLVVGMYGMKTGARGNDIVDGSEVKSCSRIDALDTCVNITRKGKCNEKVSRYETICPKCGSDNILRGNDSKWLFTIRSKEDLQLLTEDVNRIILVLSDYPDFDKGDFDVIRFQVFEIWNNSKRCSEFKNLMTNYFNNIYNTHKKKNSNKTPAPKNLWPYSFQFYKCNPIKVFSCIVKNANKQPVIKNIFYVEPGINRSSLPSELMPTSILTKDELPSLQKMIKIVPPKIIKKKLNKGKTFEDFKKIIESKTFKKAEIQEYLPFIDEELRAYLPLRIDKTFLIKTKHIRR